MNASARNPGRLHSAEGACRRRAGAIGLLLAGLLLTGCINRIGGDGRTPDQVLDETRRENLALQREVTELNQRLETRIKQLEQMEAAATQPSVPGVRVTDLPRAASVRLGRYSTCLDQNRDGRDDTLRLYILPHDQQGRFIPVTGMLEVQVVAVLPEREPRVLTQARLSPAQFDQAYRSGFTGTHYVVDLPLPVDLPAEVKNLTVQLQLTDAATNARLTCTQVLPVTR